MPSRCSRKATQPACGRFEGQGYAAGIFHAETQKNIPEPQAPDLFLGDVIVGFRGIVILSIFFMLQGQVGAQTPLEVQGNKSSKIIFYRTGTLLGAAISCPIRYRGMQLVELGRSRSAVFAVNPGNYIFSNDTSGIEVRVADGETAYIRCIINSGAFVGQSSLIQVSAEEFGRKSSGLKPKDVPVDAIR